jgi:hypothetical protein
MRIRQSLSRYDAEEGFEEPGNNSDSVLEQKREINQGIIFSSPKNYSQSRYSPKKE